MKLLKRHLGLAFLLPCLSQADIQFGADFGQLNEVANQPAPIKSKIPVSDPMGTDILRLENGDIMHGQFGGMSDGLVWKRTDVEQPIRFNIKGIRQIIFNSNNGAPITKGTSYVTLVSGDRIPGEIVSLNEKELDLKSAIVGNLTIKRELINAISPNPFDGELLYAGPFTSDGWVRLGYPEKVEDQEEMEEAENDSPPPPTPELRNKEKSEKKKKKETPPSWIHSGGAFYSITRHPLVFDAGLPAVGRLRFKVMCKSQMNFAVALHSDFTRPIPPEVEAKPELEEIQEIETEKPEDASETPGESGEEEVEEKKPELKFEKLSDLQQGTDFQTVPWLKPERNNQVEFLGTGYLLNISSYPNLSSNSYNAEGGIAPRRRLTTNRGSFSLPQNGEIDVDIRFDRGNNLIMLFINGEYYSQWTDPAGYLGEGTGIGFLNNSDNQVRISDILVTSWNGVTDSAKSMSHPDRDITLLTNGTDRFSGKLDRIENGKAYLKTNYAEIELPLTDVANIIMSKNNVADPDTPALEWENEPAMVVFKPYGLIKINPESSTPKALTGNSPFLGKINVDLSNAVMLRFLEESPDISDWFDDAF